MLLDRSQAPEFKIPEDFELLYPEKFSLKNGIQVFFFPTKGIDAVKIDITCLGQRDKLPLEQTLLPSFTLQMLSEGTENKTAADLANFLDFHASEISPILTFSKEGLSVLSTQKHLMPVLDLLIEMVQKPAFPVEMLDKRKSQRKLSLQLEREKTNSRAGQLFRKGLFGATHPYGFEVGEKEVDIITPEKIRFYSDQLLWQETEVFISGDFSAEKLDATLQYFEQLPIKSKVEGILLPEINPLEHLYENRETAVQSSIRLGYLSIPKNHPDFIPLSVFNTILGGYFGSRLIKNIREDKGHTYGIYSSLAEIGNSNYWVVSADVQKSFNRAVISEIHQEIQRLVNEPLEPEELETVRNFQIGQMLSRFSSSFDLMDRFRAVHHSDLALDFYSKKLEFLKSFSTRDIIQTGEKYFKNSPFIEVIVG
ncbi:M16 family metallopeptidase [Algoriphagus hitonicola]|uniref:Predicted Zn-dependent peptidase n=1 Tax=Algoriphagus hitonicola TaxID=435880 RepID=A0A1I2P599_9BACT|nr:insulinase family protein [Algoriphagus hitonicola]SFG09117.1 Predicted Zn-dependent peptidase [Algoriphagus hitonicola]